MVLDTTRPKYKENTTWLGELTNIQDGNIGFHLQVPRGGTHPNGVGSELTKFFARIVFCYSWFRLQLIAIHCNRRGVNITPSHTNFSRTFAHFILAHMHLHGSRCRTTCLHKKRSSTCHHVSDRLLYLFALTSSSLPSASTPSLTSSLPLSSSSSSMWSELPSTRTAAHTQN